MLALLFVTLPFVVRTVQPVLLELDREAEEAARSLGAGELRVFRSIVLPNILPGILSGVALAFARAVGEIGALVLISGNLPFKTEAASVFVFNHIQSGDQAGASAVAVVMLAISFALLLVDRRPALPRDEARTARCGGKYGLRFVALGYLLVVLLGPLAMVFYRAFDKGAGHLWDSLTDPNTVHAFKLTLEIAAIAVPLNTVFGVVCALAIVRQRFPGAGIVNAIVDLPLAISPVVVGLSLFLLYGRTGLVRARGSRITASRSCSHCRRW